MEKYTLKNNIDVIAEYNKNTPRIAIVLYMGLNQDEKITGLYYLMSELLLQGT